MERLKDIKNTLITQICGQLGHLETVDAKELGEVVDMVKDIEEALYYCTITKSMKEAEKQNKKQDTTLYYTENYYPDRDIDKHYGKMYYPEMPTHYTSSQMYYTSPEHRDYREGTSPISRRMYMESKEKNKDKGIQIKELEKYLQELTKDIVEMSEKASPEEKKIMQIKISSLAEKIK